MISQTLFPLPQPSYFYSSHTASLSHSDAARSCMVGMEGLEGQKPEPVPINVHCVLMFVTLWRCNAATLGEENWSFCSVDIFFVSTVDRNIFLCYISLL